MAEKVTLTKAGLEAFIRRMGFQRKVGGDPQIEENGECSSSSSKSNKGSPTEQQMELKSVAAKTSLAEKVMSRINFPCIGLENIREVPPSGDSSFRFFCELCLTHCATGTILPHLRSTKHQLRCLKEIKPDLYKKLVQKKDPSINYDCVLRCIKALEKKIGRGKIVEKEQYEKKLVGASAFKEPQRKIPSPGSDEFPYYDDLCKGEQQPDRYARGAHSRPAKSDDDAILDAILKTERNRSSNHAREKERTGDRRNYESHKEREKNMDDDYYDYQKSRERNHSRSRHPSEERRPVQSNLVSSVSPSYRDYSYKESRHDGHKSSKKSRSSYPSPSPPRDRYHWERSSYNQPHPSSFLKNAYVPKPRILDDKVPDLSRGDYYCRLCDSHMSSEIIWEGHIIGKRHLKNLKKEPGEDISKRKTLPCHNATAKLYSEIEDLDEPIIGLDFVTETQIKNSGDLYTCHLCSANCPFLTIIDHIVSTKHRLNVIQQKNPALHKMVTNIDIPKSSMDSFVLDRAAEFEEEYGRGQIEVRREK